MLLDPRRLLFSRYFDWYENYLGSLFRIQGTVINGIGLLGIANISTSFNYFQALSRFYSAAVLGDLPRMDATQYALIQQASEHWSVTGEAYFIRQNDRVRTVRPDYVFPITDPFDRERIVRYLFVYPERDTQQGNWFNENVSTSRARVIDYDVETQTARLSIRSYSAGHLADDPVGEPVSIGTVVRVKSGDSLYPTIETIIRELSVRLNILQLALNTTSVPIIQIEKDGINDGELRGQLTLEAFQKSINNPLGLNVVPPFGGEEGARYVERTGTGLTESLEYMRMLLGQLGVLTGVPDYVFGVQLGRPGNETERVLFAGQARVNSFRRALEDGLRQVGIDVMFASEPFVTRQQRLANILSQFSAGMITLNEARQALNLPPSAPIEPPQTSISLPNRSA